ncbi:MAG TPA: hypothetical protein VE571_13360, partial [Solirubrobacteraceae bacterium]|nr:hypothetical protein [Solirubrobacteraceae bacterium]
IQSGLAPVAEAAHADAHESEATRPEPRDPAQVVPPEAAPVPKRLADAPADSGAADLVAQLRALVDAHERLLAAAGDALASRTQAAPAHTVGLSAGPFAGTEAVRRFQRSLQALPEVRAVTVREYVGADRVIVDVHLAPPNP